MGASESMGRSALLRVGCGVVVGAALVGGLAGCSDDEGGETVALKEWAVEPDSDTLPSGEVTLTADNKGAEEHELVVMAGDDPEALPTDEDGAVIEAEVEDDIVGEIEDVPSKETRDGTFDLEPGSYILFCNIVDEEEDGEVESHFAEGMYTTVTVE